MDYEYVILYLVPKLGRVFTISERFYSISTGGRTRVPHEELMAHCEKKGRGIVLFPTTVHTQASASICFLHETSKLYDEEEI
jgi:hypothetical protein